MNSIRLAVFTSCVLATCGFSQTAPPPSNDLLPRTFKSPEEMLAAIPAEMDTRPGGSWNPAALQQANQPLSTQVKDQLAVMRLKVENIEAVKPGFRIKTPDSVHNDYKVRTWVYFNANAAAKVAKVAKGQEVVVAGRITRVDLSLANAKDAWMNIDIREAELPDIADPQSVTTAQMAPLRPKFINAAGFCGITWDMTASQAEKLIISATGTAFRSSSGMNQRHFFEGGSFANWPAQSFWLDFNEGFSGGRANLRIEAWRDPLQSYEALKKAIVAELGAPIFETQNPDTDLPSDASADVGKVREARWIIRSSDVSGNMATVTCNLSRITRSKAMIVTIGCYKGAAVTLNDSPAWQMAVRTALGAAPRPNRLGSNPQIPELALAKGWDTPMQGGSSTLGDLGQLFNGVAKPAVNLQADPTIKIYEGVLYMTPFPQALKALGITSRPPSKNLISCPGFPRDSFYYYAVDGTFEGHYNRMYIVVDKADQVVSIQLVDETPHEKPSFFRSSYDWSTYNFVNARTKAMSKLQIDHQLFAKTKLDWNRAPAGSDGKVFRVDSLLLSPGKGYGNSQLKEQVRWYVPRPVVELILTCVQKGGR